MLFGIATTARRGIAAVLLAGLAFGTVSAQSPSAPRYAISGVVISQDSGLPIAGAHLDLLHGANVVEKTDSDTSGRFEFPPVPEAIYNIQISATGYQTALSDNIALAGGPASVSLTLARTQASSSRSLKTIAHTSTRASGLQTTTTIQQQLDPSIIQKVGDLRAAESLSKLPGVNLVGWDSAIGDDIAVDIRGLKNSETQVLLDGHPIGPLGVYPASIGGGQGGYDYQVAPTFALQNLLVVYGAGATGLYGVDAVGGAVDFQTLDPTQQPAGAVQIGYGSQGKQQFAAQATGTLGKFSYIFLHGVEGAYGNFPGAIISETGDRGGDFTTPTQQGITYWVSGDYALRNDLGKLVYAFSPVTTLTLTGYSATSWDDKTGEGDNDFVTYQKAFWDALTSSNCTTSGGKAGITVTTNAGSQCDTLAQYAAGDSGPAGGGPGAFQALANQDYHVRFNTTDGDNNVVVDWFADNYSQDRERPQSFLNGPIAILNEDYRSFGELASDDIATGNNDVGFGLFSDDQYTNGDNISGNVKFVHAAVVDRLQSVFVRDVYSVGRNLQLFLNSWWKHSNIGGNSFDPRLSVVYRVTPSDVLRVTGGKSSADPAPVPLVITGVGGIGQGNCKLFSLGTVQSPGEQPERATDVEASYSHRFFADTTVQAVIYDTNEINTVFEGQEPASSFPALMAALGPSYLGAVYSHIESICPNLAPPNPPPTLANLLWSTNVNLSTSRARGVELSAHVRALPHLAIDGYWDTQSAVVDNAPAFLLINNPTLVNGAQLQGIPLHKFGIAIDASTVHGGDFYIDYTHLDGNNSLNRPPFGWADAAISQAITGSLSLNLGVTNVFNTDYQRYGYIGLGVYVPENQYGTDPNAIAQGTEEFGILPRAFMLSVTEKIQ